MVQLFKKAIKSLFSNFEGKKLVKSKESSGNVSKVTKDNKKSDFGEKKFDRNQTFLTHFRGGGHSTGVAFTLLTRLLRV